jgi:hypothetical protein
MAKHESHYIRLARLAFELTQAGLPRYSHPKSPHRFTRPQLAACVMLMFYLRLSYRDMEDWLMASDQIQQVLGLREIPDHTTLCRAFHKLTLAHWRALERRLLDQLQPVENIIAVDSTGFRPAQASAYYQLRCGTTRREWIKGAYAIGTQSQLILASRQGVDRTNDGRLLKGLRHDARRYTDRHWLLRADAGFDGQNVQDGDLNPPVRRHGTLSAPERRARADLVSQARLDGVYGQRWKCETVNSVIKRKFGDSIRSRRRSAQRCEPIVLGLIYNLRV